MGRRGVTVALPHIDRFKDRHGKMRYYFRKPGGRRVSLPDIDDIDFRSAYEAAAEGYDAPAREAAKGAPGTLDRLLFDYYASSDFRAQKPSSQKVTKGILDAIAKEHGAKRAATLPRSVIVKWMGAKADTPAAANNMLKKLRALMTFAIANGWRTDDPTLRIKRYKEGSHHTWTDAEIRQFEDKWPLGSRERTAFALALHTGQRRHDVVTMTWSAIDMAGGVIEVKQQKADDERTDGGLLIPIHRDLRAALDAWPAKHVMVFVTAYGKPFSVDGFGNKFAEWIEAAGLPSRCVMHGLRKAAARRLAEVGCSALEIASITGHKSLKEVERYTKAADQKRLARSAVARLEEHGVDKPFPNSVPKPTEK